MSDLTFNKIAGGVLATGLAIFLLREVSSITFESEPPAKAGYVIAVAEDTAGGAAARAPDVPPDWGTVLPTANVEAGKTVTAKCVSCHNFDPGGPNGTGPNLNDVLGRKPGTHPGFMYSSGMTAFGDKQPAWDYDHLYEFLKGPQKYIDGTKMTFVGLKAPEDRIAVIAYLRSLHAGLPIPAPKPAAAAPAAGAPAAGAAAGSGAPAASGAPAPGGTAATAPAAPKAPAPAAG